MERPTLFTDAGQPRLTRFPFRLSAEERDAINEAAREMGVSPTRLVRMALRSLIVKAPQEQGRRK